MRPTYNKGPTRRLDVAGEVEGVFLSLFVWGFLFDEEGGSGRGRPSRVNAPDLRRNCIRSSGPRSGSKRLARGRFFDMGR